MSVTAIKRVDEVVRSYAANRTVQQGVVLLAANTLGNALQYVFHALVSRAIGPED